MGKVLTISVNTFKEIIRDRILYGLVLFAILIIGLSRAMAGLSFAEQERIVIDFGLAGMHLSVIVLSIFVGSTLVSKELEKQTILTLLVRPISRGEFILGKFFGFVLVELVLILGLALVLVAVLTAMAIPVDLAFSLGVLGMLLEAIVLTSLTMMFGIYSKPFLSITLVMGCFIIGHWLDSLNYFAQSSGSRLFRGTAEALNYIFPNLERWNWKSVAVSKDLPSFEIVGSSAMSALAWTGLFICLTVFFFRRKDCA
ncbi:MAG: ABC transporter permease [Bdellovibrionales bacterium]